MGESRVSSGRGCRKAKGDGSRESMWIVDVAGEFVAIVRGNVGSGSVGCGDGGGVVRFKWLTIAASMISTAVSSASVITGVVMGVVMIVREEERMLVFGGSGSLFIRLSALHRP